MPYSPFAPPKRTLLGPGPSDVAPRILAAMARPTIGHLDPAFIGLMDEIKALLQLAFQTENTLTMPVSGPGTAGMETCVVNLIEPGTLYGDRIYQLDLALAKILRFGGTRLRLSADIFNILNNDAVLDENESFGRFRQPTEILLARFVKFSVQLNF